MKTNLLARVFTCVCGAVTPAHHSQCASPVTWLLTNKSPDSGLCITPDWLQNQLRIQIHIPICSYLHRCVNEHNYTQAFLSSRLLCLIRREARNGGGVGSLAPYLFHRPLPARVFAPRPQHGRRRGPGSLRKELKPAVFKHLFYFFTSLLFQTVRTSSPPRPAPASPAAAAHEY